MIAACQPFLICWHVW